MCLVAPVSSIILVDESILCATLLYYNIFTIIFNVEGIVLLNSTVFEDSLQLHTLV